MNERAERFRPKGTCSHHAAARDELDDEHHDSDDKEEVNQAPGHVETEAENPQDQKNDKNRPEHAHSFRPGWNPWASALRRLHELDANSLPTALNDPGSFIEQHFGGARGPHTCASITREQLDL